MQVQWKMVVTAVAISSLFSSAIYSQEQVQEEGIDDFDAEAAIARLPRIENQPYYPQGYYDTKVVASDVAAQMLEEHRASKQYLLDFFGEEFLEPNQFALPTSECEESRRWVNRSSSSGPRHLRHLAFWIARMEDELQDAGFPEEVFVGPLLDFERLSLVHFQQSEPERREPLPVQKQARDVGADETSSDKPSGLPQFVPAPNLPSVSTIPEHLIRDLLSNLRENAEQQPADLPHIEFATNCRTFLRFDMFEIHVD